MPLYPRPSPFFLVNKSHLTAPPLSSIRIKREKLSGHQTAGRVGGCVGRRFVHFQSTEMRAAGRWRAVLTMQQSTKNTEQLQMDFRCFPSQKNQTFWDIGSFIRVLQKRLLFFEQSVKPNTTKGTKLTKSDKFALMSEDHYPTAALGGSFDRFKIIFFT